MFPSNVYLCAKERASEFRVEMEGKEDKTKEDKTKEAQHVSKEETEVLTDTMPVSKT